MDNVVIPTVEQVKQDFENTTGYGTHPRIMLNKNGFEKLRLGIKTDSYIENTYENVYNKAVGLIDKPTCTYQLEPWRSSCNIKRSKR